MSRAAQSAGVSVAQAASDLEPRENLLRRRTKETAADRAEVEKLRCEVAKLRAERDILKMAAADFAREAR